MYKVIDCAWNIGAHAAELKAAGIDTVIRYFNRQNSAALPSKRLEQPEAEELAESGLSLCTVYQQRGGAGGRLEDFEPEAGRADCERAMRQAAEIGQPDGSAIYFAVDHDYFRASELRQIERYFEAVRARAEGRFRIGVYGSGTVGRALVRAGHADLVWLAAATGWSGTRDLLETDQWALYQIHPPRNWNGRFTYDGNVVGSRWADFGQFRLGAAGRGAVDAGRGPAASGQRPVQLSEVVATGGLNLRRGPGETFAVEHSYAKGTLVHVLGQEGAWAKVDVNGDGSVDGYMHAGFLRAVSGGLPAGDAVGSSPYAVALAELALDIREVPGRASNPRISLYHRSTNQWAGTSDDVSWCSSFVNYCVEQAGYTGTNRQDARSWENWGRDVTGAPREGDIAVFSRTRNAALGHVAFFVEDLGDHVKILGGNQSDRVRYSVYPKDGEMGGVPYRLLTIRRA